MPFPAWRLDAIPLTVCFVGALHEQDRRYGE